MSILADGLTVGLELNLSLPITTAASGEKGHVLILSSSSGEAARLHTVIAQAALHPEPCRNMAELCDRLENEVDVVVLAAEWLSPIMLEQLRQSLARQPSWSDLPLLVLCDSRTIDAWPALDGEKEAFNATLLERPVSTRILHSALHSALRARHRQYQLRDSLAELTRAEHHERGRLAQLLHDHLQQLLVAARIKIEFLQRDQDLARLLAALRQIDDLLSQVLDASRRLTVELCPPILHDAGFSAALGWLVHHVEEMHGLHVMLDADSSADPLTNDRRLLLFEALRELLFNIVKHAGVDHAQVTVSHAERDCVRVVVIDQGRGFDARCLDSLPGGRGGFGLFTLRQRLASLGGRLAIETAPGHGTQAIMMIPRQ